MPPTEGATGSHEDHPTRRLLLQSTADLLNQHPPDRITSAMVLEASGVSSGSLYHHFEDFPDLLEHAMALQFTAWASELVDVAQAAVDAAEGREVLRQHIRAIYLEMCRSERSTHRLFRVQVYATSANSQRFQATIRREQQRLTDRMAELISRAQQRGDVIDACDPAFVAVLVQAISVGQVVDDMSERQLSDGDWGESVAELLTAMMFGPRPEGSAQVLR